MDEDSGLQQELELLEAIYLEDLSVDASPSGEVSCVRVQIYPATGDNAEEKYVCLTLEFNVAKGYPDTVPEMVIRNPRGLADEHVRKLRQSLHDLAAELAGMPMLYELIELGKESLTESNVPHGQCVICLEYFARDEPFTKTECYHYFHCCCLLRYVRHCHEQLEKEREEIRQHKHMTLEKKDVVCPVCREPISFDLASLQAQSPLEDAGQEQVFFSDQIRHLQQQMASLYARQKAKGGIIDVEAERNKFLLPSESNSNDAHPTAAPHHLFNQGIRPIGLIHSQQGSVDRSKGRGKPMYPKASDRPGQDRPERKESRSDHRKDSRHRDRRHQGGGREKSREEKQHRSDSGNPRSDRGYRNRNQDRRGEDERVRSEDRDSSLGKGSGGGAYDSSRVKDDSHEESRGGEKAYPPRRNRRGGGHGGKEYGGDRENQHQTSENTHHSHQQYRQQVRRDHREDHNGEALPEYKSASARSSEGWRSQRPGSGEAGPSEGDTERDESRSDRPGPPRRRWSGRGRGRNFHDSRGGGSNNKFHPTDSKPNPSHHHDLDNGHGSEEAPAEPAQRKNDNQSYRHAENHHRDQDSNKYGRRSEPRNDRRKYNNRSYSGRGGGKAHNYDRMDRDCDSNEGRNEVAYSSHNDKHSLPPPTSPPPGLSERCKPPPGFYQAADNHRPRPPPGFDDGS